MKLSEMTLTEKDMIQLDDQQISLETVEKQIEDFKKGFPFLAITKAATIGDGILKLEDNEIDAYARQYEAAQAEVRVIKFVPSSGAASRMFKDLFTFLNAKNPVLADHPNVQFFIEHLEKFAFYDKLKTIMKEDDQEIETVLKEGDFQEIIGYVLTEKGLDYGNLPKGLIQFHNYFDGARIAAEEHLVEGKHYGKGENDTVVIHFTVSPEHLPLFKQAINEGVKKQNDTHFDVSFSVQKSSTNTIAVDMENNPFREPDGSILFRPAGHGALISNLDDLEAEIIFIKNIDNIVPDRLKDTTYRYKKALAGKLLEVRKQIIFHMGALNTQHITPGIIAQTRNFVESVLNYQFAESFHTVSLNEQANALKSKLNRPIRICGMVKNEGEPGGGPFWVKDKQGGTSLQIVETSQIDLNNASQKSIVDQATHFNPVDLVCCNVDFQGRKFDLKKYVDPVTGFITEKSKDGKKLKAQELPGLWNGSMSDWNTIFLEVPIITFNPVKTVNDLIRDQHQ